MKILGMTFKLNMQINNWNLKHNMHKFLMRISCKAHANNSSLICLKPTIQKVLLYWKKIKNKNEEVLSMESENKLLKEKMMHFSKRFLN